MFGFDLFDNSDPLERTATYHSEQEPSDTVDSLLTEVDRLEQHGYPMLTELGTAYHFQYGDSVDVSLLHDDYHQQGPENLLKLEVSVDAAEHQEELEDAYASATETLDNITGAAET